MTMTRRPHSAGLSEIKSFSIAELLVAIAILSILMVILLGMLSSLTRAWQSGQAHNERRTVAQTVLDRMSRDLRQAALPTSQNTTNSLEFVISSASWLGTTQYPQAIFFQAPVATDNGTNGNLAVVGYCVQWVNGTPTLSRVLVNPSSSQYTVYSGGASGWLTASWLSSAIPVPTANNYKGLLAENVLGLWMQALDPTGTNSITQAGLPAGETFDSRYPFTYMDYDLNAGNGRSVTKLAGNLPSSVQIAIAVVDSRTAKHLTGTEKPAARSANGIWWDVQNFYNGLNTNIQQGVEIQTTTVPLANGPR